MMWFQFIFGERTSVFSLFVLRFSQEWREEFTFHFPLDPEQRCDCWAELSESFIITLGLDFTWNQICSRTTHTHLVTKVRLKSGNKDKKKLFWSFFLTYRNSSSLLPHVCDSFQLMLRCYDATSSVRSRNSMVWTQHYCVQTLVKRFCFRFWYLVLVIVDTYTTLYQPSLA